MPASIIFNQPSTPAGIAGKARDDLVTGALVTCTNATVETTYRWILVDVPIRSALSRGMLVTSPTFSFTPDVKGTYLVSLQVNGSALPADNVKSFIAIRSTLLNWRYLAAGEKTEDNIERTSLGFPADVNPRGWATDRDLQEEQVEDATYKVQTAVATSPGVGFSPLVKVNTITGQIDPSLVPSVASISENDFVLDPTGVDAGNTHTDFSALYLASVAFNGIKRVFVFANATITSGNYDLRKYEFYGAASLKTLTFSGTSVITFPPFALNHIDFINDKTTTLCTLSAEAFTRLVKSKFIVSNTGKFLTTSVFDYTLILSEESALVSSGGVPIIDISNALSTVNIALHDSSVADADSISGIVGTLNATVENYDDFVFQNNFASTVNITYHTLPPKSNLQYSLLTEDPAGTIVFQPIHLATPDTIEPPSTGINGGMSSADKALLDTMFEGSAVTTGNNSASIYTLNIPFIEGISPPGWASYSVDLTVQYGGVNENFGIIRLTALFSGIVYGLSAIPITVSEIDVCYLNGAPDPDYDVAFNFGTGTINIRVVDNSGLNPVHWRLFGRAHVMGANGGGGA